MHYKENTNATFQKAFPSSHRVNLSNLDLCYNKWQLLKRVIVNLVDYYKYMYFRKVTSKAPE